LKTAGPVFLVGLMGSGKSTVGRLLAKALGVEWIDLDAAIETAARKPVAAIFTAEGEAEFRRRENRALRCIPLKRPAVVSCGGGVVLAPENRRILKKAFTVYLAASPAVLARRLTGAQARKRPLLKGRGALAALKSLQKQRAHHYRACARLVLLAGAEPALIVKRLLKRLRQLS
jgi:shikimate kinase